MINLLQNSPPNLFQHARSAQGLVRKLVLFAITLLAFTTPSWALSPDLAAVLTPAEKEWLRQHPVLRAAASNDLPPLEIIDPTGTLSGIAGDYKRLIERKTGLTFQVVPASSWTAVFDLLKRDDADIVFGAARTQERAEYLDFTNALYEVPMVLIVRTQDSSIRGMSDLIGKKVGVLEHTSFAESLTSTPYGVTPVMVPSVREGISALSSGEVSAFFGGLPTAAYEIQRLGVLGLKVAGEVGLPTQRRIAVRKGMPELLSILNKSIWEISAQDHASIRQRWIALPVPGADLRKLLMILVPIFGAALLVILLLFNVRLRAQVHARVRAQEELAAEHEHLEDLVNERTAQLARSEAWARTVIDTVGDGIVILGEDYHIETVNAACARLLGYTEKELVGMDIVRLLTQSDQERISRLRESSSARAAESRGPGIRQITAVRKDGTEFPAEYSRQDFTSDDGQHIVISLRDVTERQRTNAALRTSMEEISDLYNNAPCGYHSLDAEGLILRINDTELEWLGYTRDEVVGKMSVLELLTDESRATFGRNFPAFKQRGQLSGLEMDFRRKDGSILPLIVSATAYRDEHGAYLGSRSTLFDNTERRRMIEELRAATKAAHDANQAKSSFLANMSHEIRTPMNAVIGFSNLALRTELNVRQRDYVSKIHNAAVSLLGLINDILDFSKIEAGKLSLETVEFSLDAVIDNVVSALAPAIADRGLEILSSVSPEAPQNLRGDPHRLSQILMNLLGNAGKFTREGEIELRVSLLEKTGEMVKLLFSVRDTGIGMTKEQIADLFQPFHQADNSTTRHFGGTGLGLSISRHLVELMGGQIWAESAPARGSTFTFTCWIGVSPVAAPRRGIPGTLGGMRVLIVDDNHGAREILAGVLASVGFRVESAASGEEGVAAVAREDDRDPFGLVLLDWKMPGIDGIEAARRIRDAPELKHRPVVFLLSASGAGEEERVKAAAAGAKDFLTKPVSASTLIDAVLRAFAPELVSDAALPAADERDRQELRGARLLLVEDNEINQQVAAELLGAAGAAVTIVGNGREAVEALARSPARFDVVLMDIQMPEMDGYEATRRIRALPAGAEIPIIAMTAHAMVEEREKALQTGMSDHISKPIDPDAMFATLRKYVRPSPDGGAAGKAVPRTGEVGPEKEEPQLRIEGVDTAAGIARVAGNRRLYAELVRKFAHDAESSAADIAAAMESGDRERAERLAHTLKGIAGNLGVRSVQDCAADLERALRAEAPREELAAARDRLRDALRTAAQAIGAEAAHLVPPEGSPKLSATEVDVGALERLCELIQHNDADALELFETIEGSLAATAGQERTAHVRKALGAYDFISALPLVVELRTAVERRRGNGGRDERSG